MNAVLPDDIWISAAYQMREDFHPRYSAVSRSYAYFIGTDANAASPFRRRTELVWPRPLDVSRMRDAASALLGTHRFLAFAVKGTAPDTDDHSCTVTRAEFVERPGGLAFRITANRFLHHMVRFIVGTMLEIGTGRSEPALIPELLASTVNERTGSPAPAHALFLEHVEYPKELYLGAA